MSEEKNAPRPNNAETTGNAQTGEPAASDTAQSGNAENEAQGTHGTELEKTIPTSQDTSEPEDRLAMQSSPEEPENPIEATASDTTANMPSEVSGGIWSAIFNGCARGGPLILLVVLACVAWHDFIYPDRAVYCPPEFSTITAFLHCIAQGSWLTPTGLENGAWSAPLWPGFLWFIGLLNLIPGLTASSLLLPAAELTAAAAAIVAIWWLAHSCKFGSRAAFAAGAMALCCPLYAPLPHFMGPAALAAGLLLLALLFFYKGWTKEFSFISLPLAFIFTALAGLTGGILHFATPLLASICYLVWRGSFKRSQRLDALAGFILMLAIIGCWLGMVILKGDNATYLSNLFADSIKFSWPPANHWWFALAAGFLGSLPWLLTIFGVSWVRVLGKSGESFKNSRYGNGSALIWTSLVIATAIAVCIPQFHASAVAICSILLILLGKAFIRMPSGGNRFFFFLAALITTLVGIALLAMHFEFTQNFILAHLNLPIPEIARTALREVQPFAVIAAILIIGGGIGFYFAKRFCHGGGVIYALLIAILLCQPARLWLVPKLSEDKQLPVRNYAAILAEVDSALKNVSIMPDDATTAAPALPSNATPEHEVIMEPVVPDVGQSLNNQSEPNERGSTVAPEQPQAVPVPEEVIIIEKTPVSPQTTQEVPAQDNGSGNLQQQNKEARESNNNPPAQPPAEQTPAQAPEPGLAPAPISGPNGEAIAEPGSSLPSLAPPASPKNSGIEEVIIEKITPAQPDNPVQPGGEPATN